MSDLPGSADDRMLEKVARAMALQCERDAVDDVGNQCAKSEYPVIKAIIAKHKPHSDGSSAEKPQKHGV